MCVCVCVCVCVWFLLLLTYTQTNTHTKQQHHLENVEFLFAFVLFVLAIKYWFDAANKGYIPKTGNTLVSIIYYESIHPIGYCTNGGNQLRSVME